jgi:transposase InsO family protein
MIETQFNKKIKILRTDNGTKYVNQNFISFLNKKGNIHRTTNVYTPQQNGVSERKNHLLEIARSLLIQNNVPKFFWSEGVITATYLINKLPSVILDFKSPLEILFQRKINLNHLRVF